MYTSIVSFFQDGGTFMYPILLVLAIGLAIAIERYIYLTASKTSNRQLLAKAMPLLKQGDFEQLQQLTSRKKNAISQMLNQGLSRVKTAKRRDDIESAIEESMMEVIPRLEKRTHYLAMFANIATLLGLLGTIIGLIKAFTAVAQVDPSMKAEILSSSISVAMNTTAFGLIVAIPLIFIYTVLQTKTTEIVDSLEMATVKFVNLIVEHKQ
ncbi:MAG: MotA/TolQ/ExbB proton channel family protein [Gammaproteobacteria bacterium]|nr:MotA/TolQ/ExbB proton channel family protein [Gammaproteobacteria bacterium]MCW8911205.1 MotA/TolQ/ExbB proton channel family protein [Gammaproteobacteria bacterium]MCW9005075.1 MotA/TolQ/ExbB proton channel family protein [Gammaproteobacteria bacterium]MCW9055871.1 MotA/TolQ/ExbB proton channel family protein [Gammaproteobacteria bacterium]